MRQLTRSAHKIATAVLSSKPLIKRIQIQAWPPFPFLPRPIKSLLKDKATSATFIEAAEEQSSSTGRQSNIPYPGVEGHGTKKGS
jgi:hypothetical protein